MLTLGLLLFGALAAVDRGAFDSALVSFASKRLKRPISVEVMRIHLLTGRPSVALRGLKIANPDWGGRSNLVEARRLDVGLRWGDLLVLRFAPSEVEADGVSLNLVRAAKDRKSWGDGNGGGGSLRAIRRLTLTDARFTYDDRVRDMRISGTLSHDARRDAALPLAMAATGQLKGAEVSLQARGGPLNGRARRAPYPFQAQARDGATFLAVRGSTAEPFSFAGFDLAVAARGPNLAEMKYLIGVGLPNSAPYALTGRLTREGRTTRATGLKAKVGKSDFTGSIISDGSKPRRLISIDLTSRTLDAADVGAFLADRPDHMTARSVSGAVRKKNDGRLFSDEAIDLKRFRLKDARLKIAADRFVIGGVAPGRLTVEAALDQGRFALKPFRLAFPAGRADGSLTMELNGPVPAFGVDGVAQGALGALVPSLAQTLNGAAELRVKADGAGGSWKTVALNAKGRLRLTVRDGDLQASKAKVLSGAVIQGAFTALADKSARTPLSCLAADMKLGGGRLDAEKIVMVTESGSALIEGGVDLKSETLAMTVRGRPAKKTLFSVAAPVSLSGPMLSPQAKVRLGGGGSEARPPEVVGDRRRFCDRLIAASARP